MLSEIYSAKVRKNLRLFAILATDKLGNIGKDNKIPWRVPSDLKRFKRLTKNHAIIMGRKTYESLEGPLLHRTNIVISREKHETTVPGQVWAQNMTEALELCPPNKTAWIIGGAEIYKQFMPYVDVVHHTIIDTEIQGDAQVKELPQLQYMPGWFEVKREIFNEDGDEHASAYIVHAKIESVLKNIGFDING